MSVVGVWPDCGLVEIWLLKGEPCLQDCEENPVEVTIRLPDDIAHHLQEKWAHDIPHRPVESVALECFRQRILGESQLRRLLGFETRFEVHAFLK
jgi:hypothetical protein